MVAPSVKFRATAFDGSQTYYSMTVTAWKAVRQQVQQSHAWPTFPLQGPVSCRFCGEQTQQNTVLLTNKNGNVGRSYYSCPTPGCRFWVTSDDDRGLRLDNPPCDCGPPSRQDKKGKDKITPVQGFWTCAAGQCDFYSEDLDRHTPMELEGLERYAVTF